MKKFILILMVSGFVAPALAQEEISVISPALEVTAFNKFVDIPVSMYTGVPNTIGTPSNTFQKYEYEGFGRFIWIKNHQNNVLIKNEYHCQQPSN